MAQEIKIELKIEGLEVGQKNVKLLNSSIKTLADTSEKTKDSLSGISKTLSSVKGAFGSVIDSVTSLSGLFLGLAAGFSLKQTIDAAIAQEEAINELNVALRITGQYSDATSKSLQDFASEMQRTTRFSDDSVLKTQSLIQSLANLDEKGLKKATTAAIEMASALRLDLNTAATLVGKSAIGEIGTFSRYGIVIQKSSSDAKTFANTLDVLNSKFGGSAVGQVNTFAGAFDQLQNAFGDLLEEAGNIVIKNPILIDAIKSTTVWIYQLIGSFDEARKNIRDFAIKVLEKFIEMGDTISVIFIAIKSTFYTAFIAVLIEMAFIVARTTKLMAKDFVIFAAEVGASLRAATVSISAFAAAIRASTLAVSIFKGVISFGLFIALDLLIGYILTLKDEVGTWGNLFTVVSNKALSAIYAISIPVKQLTLDAIELAAKGFGAVFEGINKLRALVSLPPKGVGFLESINEAGKSVEQDLAIVKRKIIAFETESAGIYQDAADKNGKIFGQEFAQKMLDELKGSGEKAAKVVDEGAKKDPPKISIKIDENKIKSDFENLQKSLRGIEDGELGKIKANYDAQNEIIRKAYKNQVVLEDGTVVSKKVANELKLANDKDYLEKRLTLERKNADEILKTITSAVSSASAFLKFGVEVFFSPTAAKQFKPLVDAISKNFPKAASFLDKTVGKLLDGVTFMGIEVGKIVMAFFDIFTQAPEKFSEMFTNMIAQLPLQLANIMTNIANLIGGPIAMSMVQGFIANIPTMIKQFTYSLVTLMASPMFWLSVAYAAVEALITAIPAAGQAFIDGIKDGFNQLISTNLFKKFGENIFEGFRDLFEKFNPVNILSKMFKLEDPGSGTIEKFTGLHFPFVKFASGGIVNGPVKTGGDASINDVVPALLSAGEVVLPRSIVKGGAGSVIEFLKSIGVPIMGLKFGGRIGGAISGAISSVIGSASGAISGVVDVGGGFISDAINQIQNVLGINVIPEWIMELYRSLKAIGASVDLVDLVKNPMASVTGAVRGVIGTFLKGPLSKVMRPPELAQGGEVKRVPGGFAGDTFGPAMLTSGEMVIDRSTSQRLKTFLENPQSEERTRAVETLLVRVLDLLERPIQVESTLAVDNRAFADIMLTLNRSNARITA